MFPTPELQGPKDYRAFYTLSYFSKIHVRELFSHGVMQCVRFWEMAYLMLSPLLNRRWALFFISFFQIMPILDLNES